MLQLLALFGTRPEAIKMAPAILEMRRRKEHDPIICVTAQHRDGTLHSVLTQAVEVWGEDCLPVFLSLRGGRISVFGYLPGEELTRDYFRVEDEMGRRFWLYRAGQPPQASASSRPPMASPTAKISGLLVRI